MTLVCFAVKEEARFFRQLAAGKTHVRTILTGMGKRNAEVAVRAALEKAKPAVVLTCGFAGGLRPNLASGTVVFDANGAPGLIAALRAAGAESALFHCANRVATTAGEKRAMRAGTGADAVDMESEVICSVCREQKLASAIVRVILDTEDEDLPLDFNELMTARQKLNPVKLGLAVMSSPGKIGALMRLQRQSAAAAKRLARVLNEVV